MTLKKVLKGAWLIVEMGDAQVAEMPPDTTLPTFHAEVLKRA